MIKLLYEFDKAINCTLSGIAGREYIQNLILDDLSSIDVNQVICPMCGSREIHWNLCRTRIQSFIWDNPDKPIYVEIPLYLFSCPVCRTERTEMISTDITVDRTNLSYHYLFGIIRAKIHSAEKGVFDLHNLLYAKLCEESVGHWVRRFRSDFQSLSHFMELEQDDLLNERMKMGEIFKVFFLAENRFFMTCSQTDMLIYTDSQGTVHCTRGRGFSSE